MKGEVAGSVKHGADVHRHPTGDGITHQRWLSVGSVLHGLNEVHIQISLLTGSWNSSFCVPTIMHVYPSNKVCAYLGIILMPMSVGSKKKHGTDSFLFYIEENI